LSETDQEPESESKLKNDMLKTALMKVAGKNANVTNAIDFIAALSDWVARLMSTLVRASD
jgi:hypothetical protein